MVIHLTYIMILKMMACPMYFKLLQSCFRFLAIIFKIFDGALKKIFVMFYSL